MPENNIIAKKLSLNLDAKKQTIIKVNAKDFTAVIGDSIEVTVHITEDNTPKDLTGLKVVRLIGVRADGSYFEQTEKITIIDNLNGIIKIHPRLDVYSIEGQTISGLILEDEDEVINIQRFTINVVKSMATDIVAEAKDDIETLKKLNDLLDKYELDLVNINKSIVEMESKVDKKVTEVDGKFNELSNNIGTEINDLQNKVDGLDNTINYVLIKRIKLDIHRISGSNYIYFKLDIGQSAKQLLRKHYMISIGGIVESGNFNCSDSILNFYSTSDKVYPFIINISDRTIGSRNINASVVYSNMSNEIGINSIVDSIYIKTNINKNLNTDGDCYAYITPLAE